MFKSREVLPEGDLLATQIKRAASPTLKRARTRKGNGEESSPGYEYIKGEQRMPALATIRENSDEIKTSTRIHQDKFHPSKLLSRRLNKNMAQNVQLDNDDFDQANSIKK